MIIYNATQSNANHPLTYAAPRSCQLLPHVKKANKIDPTMLATSTSPQKNDNIAQIILAEKSVAGAFLL